ncbi:hypothetical protein V6N12_073692 [Hibiscus sabdariffa]|uniref:Aspartic peptidase DDI1-type domain-containing protein n=1 Tax=Hibiscus sabdariffa TaxID=183260 RepID=A0ABR2CT68_9ROSI
MGGFPSDTEVAKGLTHEQCKAISTRSGGILNSQNKQGDKAAAHTSSLAVLGKLAEADIPAEADEDHMNPSKPKEADSAAEAPHIKLPRTDKLEEIRPPPPFPQRLKKQKQEYQFKKFFDILKHVHIKLPLVEALQQMPNYAKFLMDMVSRKTRIREFETAAATEACLAMMHNKVPAKKTDPESFTIPCSIGNNYSCKALCDPGASINLMPKFVFQKLGIEEAKPITMMLQLAGRSYVELEGKIEDILVRVDKFIFPVDFLIMDCETDEHAPIILGKQFLATGRVMIDFEKGELALRVNEEQVKIKKTAPPLFHFLLFALFLALLASCYLFTLKNSRLLQQWKPALHPQSKGSTMQVGHRMEYNRQEPRNRQPPESPTRGKTVEHFRQKEPDVNFPQSDSLSHKAGVDQRYHHKIQVQRG